MTKLFMSLALLFFIHSTALAQDRQVSGQVASQDKGEKLVLLYMSAEEGESLS